MPKLKGASKTTRYVECYAAIPTCIGYKIRAFMRYHKGSSVIIKTKAVTTAPMTKKEVQYN